MATYARDIFYSSKQSNNYKFLVTGGCEFSQEWPNQLSKHLNTICHNYASPRISNDVIAVSVVYGIERLLQQGINASDILVGIMWANPDRRSFFKNTLTDRGAEEKHGDFYTWYENYSFVIKNEFSIYNNITPCNIDIRDFTGGSYSVQNWIFNTDKSNAWYKSVHYNTPGSRLKTLEKIIWLQSYLNEKNITYFMSTSRERVLEPEEDDNLDYLDGTMFTNTNYTWIKTLLNMNYFLPISSFESMGTGNYPSHKHNNSLVADIILPYIVKN